MTNTKLRKLTRKQVQKVLVEFDMAGKLEALMTQMEAQGLVWRRPDDVLLPWKRPPSTSRDYVVLTTAGVLGVSRVYPPFEGGNGDTIFCVWDDPSNRNVPYGVSQNGKWNHHAFAGYVHSPTSREEILKRLNDTWRSFCRQMDFFCPDDYFAPDPIARIRAHRPTWIIREHIVVINSTRYEIDAYRLGSDGSIQFHVKGTPVESSSGANRGAFHFGDDACTTYVCEKCEGVSTYAVGFGRPECQVCDR